MAKTLAQINTALVALSCYLLGTLASDYETIYIGLHPNVAAGAALVLVLTLAAQWATVIDCANEAAE